MSKVIYGVEGIRQRNYRVWINFEDMTTAAGELGFIEAVDLMGDIPPLISASPPDYSNAKEKLDALKQVMYRVGEMRADSIEVSVEDGDSVEGNEVGKIVMGKTGKFSAELINSTPDILTWLGQRDTKECIIMLEEMDSSRLKNYDDAMLETHEIIFIGNLPAMAAGHTDNVGGAFNYVEKVVGKNIATSILNVEKTVSSAGAFRKIYDFQYEELCAPPEILSEVLDKDKFVLTVGVDVSIPSEYYVIIEIASDANFSNIIHRAQDISSGTIERSFDMDGQSLGTYHFKVYIENNGVQKSLTITGTFTLV